LQDIIQNLERGRKSPLCFWYRMEITETIRALANGQLQEKGQYVVDVVVSVKRMPRKILVIVDGDKDVTIDDCATVSRYLTDNLSEDLMDGDFRLEVSSPGLDQPLKLNRQYVKNVGRKLRVTVDDTVVEGDLVEATDSGIVLNQRKEKKNEEEQTLRFTYNQIHKAIVIPTFK
jgi:ribosome maturation factor RimP